MSSLLLVASLLLSTPAHAEIVRNDSVEAGDRIVFHGGFRAMEWFASTFEIPEELIPWRLCRILAWIGPNGVTIYTLRMWNDPADAEFDQLDILMDTGDDVYQYTGSVQQITGINLQFHDLVFSEPRIRLGFRHTEGFPAPPSIASDTDGFQPRMNHMKAAIGRGPFQWHTVDDLPAGAQPDGDWVIRLEVVHEDDACPDVEGNGGPVFPGEGGDPDPEPAPSPDPDPDPEPEPDPDPEPDGQPGGDTQPPPASTGDLRIDLAVPDALPDDQNQLFALLGDGFAPGLTITVECMTCGAGGQALAFEAFDIQVRSAQSLTGRLPTPNMPTTDYDVTVRRADGAFSTLPNGVRVVALSGDGAPVIQGVVPGSVDAGAGAPLLIEGIGFALGALAFLDDVAMGGVEVLSSTRIVATVPTALAAGSYDLTIRNPGGLVSPPWPVTLNGTASPPQGPTGSGGCAQPAWATFRAPSIAWLALLLGGRCSGGGAAGAGPPAVNGLSEPARIHQIGPADSLVEAMAAAEPGDALALSAGVRTETLIVDKAVTVYGPAGERAVIGGLIVSAGAVGATIARLDVVGAGDLVVIEAGADVVLSDLGITAEGGRGVEVRGKARIERMVVHAAAGEGVLFIDGGMGEFVDGKVEQVSEHDDRNTGACIAAVQTAGPVVIRDSVLLGCSLRGVRVYKATGVTVSGNDIVGARLVGISVSSDSDAVVVGNSIRGSKGAAVTAGIGIAIDRSTAQVDKNRIEDSGLFGIRAEDSTMTATGNHIRTSGQRGISVSRGVTTLTANVLEDHPDFGMFIADGAATIERNQVRQSTGVGIWVSGPLPEGAAFILRGNRVERTAPITGSGLDASFATGEGLAIVQAGTAESPVIVSDNDLDTGAGNGIAMDRAVAVIEGNRIQTNGLAGMAISGSPAPVILRSNRVIGNGGAGIELIASPAQMSDNVITGNGGDGVVLVAGASATMNGDTIEGNGRFGVLCVGGSLTPVDVDLSGNGLGEILGCAPPP